MFSTDGTLISAPAAPHCRVFLVTLADELCCFHSGKHCLRKLKPLLLSVILTRHKHIHRQVYLCAVLLSQLDTLSDGGEASFALEHLTTEDADKANQLLLGPDNKGCNRNVGAVVESRLLAQWLFP